MLCSTIRDKKYKKWSISAVNSTVSYVKKTLVVPVDEVLVFKDASDKRLEANIFI